MSNNEDPRAGRGAANTGNANWYNSPLWDNIGPAARKKKEQQETRAQESVYSDEKIRDNTTISNTDEEADAKTKAKKLFGSLY